MPDDPPTESPQRYLHHWLWGAIPLACAIWTRGLWAPDEPRRAQVARELFASDDLLVLRWCGALYPDKPPLFYWLTGLLGSQVSWQVGVLRLVPLGAVLFTAWCVSRWGRACIGSTAGRLAPWLLLTSVMILQQGQKLQIDPLLMAACTAGLWIAAGPAAGCRWPRSPASRILVVGAVAGVGALLKGPVAWLWLAGVPLIWWLWPPPGGGEDRERRASWRWGSLAGAAALAVLPVTAWAAVVAARHPELVQPLFFDQHLGRVTSGIHHQRPVWKYALFIVPLLLPWSHPVLAGLVCWGRRLGGGRRHPPGYDPAPWHRPALWFVGMFVVFSLIPTKRDVYLLPMFPAAALLGAAWWGRGLDARPTGPVPGWFHRPLVVVLGIAAVGLGTTAWWLPRFGIGLPALDVPGMVLRATCLALVPAAVAWWLVWVKRRADRWRWTRTLMAGWTACALAAALVLQTHMDPAKSAEGLSRWVASLPQRPSAIPAIGLDPAAYRFYGAGPVVDGSGDIREHMAREGDRFLALIRGDYWRSLGAGKGSRMVALRTTHVGNKEVVVVGVE